MAPRTIDNLGVDVSTRYAEDQKILDKQFIKESRTVPRQAEIDVTFPSFSSELDTFLEATKPNIPWANFFAPRGYFEQRKEIFTFLILPSLGTTDKKEAQLEKLKEQALPLIPPVEGIEEDERERKRKRERELDEEEYEQKILINMLENVITLERFFIDINASRNQYQKG